MKALILAAGLGTRLKPWTLYHPKALAEVNGKTLLERTILYLQSAGINDVIINVHHFADQVISALATHRGWGSRYEISDERSLLMDTGGAIMRAADYGYLQDTERFIVINADILTNFPLQALIDQQHKCMNLATLAVSERTSSRRLLFDRATGLLGGWEHTGTGQQKITREMQSYQALAFSGVHCISTKIIALLSKEPAFNGQTPFSIIDAYLLLSKDYKIGYFDHTGSKFMDTGTPERLEEAGKLFS